jgi:hypothetical protein
MAQACQGLLEVGLAPMPAAWRQQVVVRRDSKMAEV